MILSEDLIPLRMLNEYLYCRRLFWYEYVDNIFIDSEDTIHGRFLHRNVDDKKEINESAKDVHATAVTMSSEKYGITGKFDLITSEDGLYIPNEYKSGKEQKNGQPWDNDIYQTVAQAMLLLDNGYKCDYGYVYYFKTKNRIKAYFNIDVNLLKSYRLDESAELLLLNLSMYKITRFCESGLRLRTACDLTVNGKLTATNINYEIHDSSYYLSRVKKLIEECKNKDLFAGSPYEITTDATYVPKKGETGKNGNKENEQTPGNDDNNDND